MILYLNIYELIDNIKSSDLKNNFKIKPGANNNYFNTDHLKTGLKKRAVQGAGATVFSTMLIYVIQMVGTIVLARLLSPEDFGLITMVTAFSLLLQNFGVNGFTEAIIQKDNIYHKEISTLFWINLGLSFGLTLLFIGFAPFVAEFYKEPRVKSVTIAMSVTIIITGLSTLHLALLKRNMQYYRYSANEIIATVISVIIAIVLASRGWEYWSLVARRLSLPLATTIGAWLLCRWRPGLPSRETEVGSILKFAIHTYGNFITNYFTRNLDKILIGWHSGTYSLGNYEKAYHLANMPVNQITVPLADVALSALSRLIDDPAKFQRYYFNALSTLAFIGMAVSLVLTLVGRDLILLLLGPQWEQAGMIFTIFGPGIGIMLIYDSHGWLHLSLGRPDRWFRWGIFAFVVTITSFIIGLPFGPVGIAVAYTASFYFLVGPGLWYAGRPLKLKLSLILSAIWKFYISALLSGLLSWFILYSNNFTADIYRELNILVRIPTCIVFCMSSYLLFSITFCKSLKPIFQLISLLNDMVPNVFSKKK